MSFNFYVVNGLVIRNNSLGKYEVKDLNTNTWKQSNDPYIGRMVSNDGTQVNLDTAEEGHVLPARLPRDVPAAAWLSSLFRASRSQRPGSSRSWPGS